MTAAPRRDGARLLARLARTPGDLRAAQGLRHRLFRDRRGLPPRPRGLDADDLDPLCRHLLVEDEAGALLGCCRLMLFADGRGLGGSYAARAHDLSRLAAYPRPLLEVGRFCALPERDAEALRAAWGALAALVDRHAVALLFGCSSFEGTDPAPHAEALRLLGAAHLGPPRWRPGPGAGECLPLPTAPPADPLAALRALPPLLRSYLAMGGWVGSHAALDRDMATLHVLTAVEIAAIPPARARALRALAAPR